MNTNGKNVNRKVKKRIKKVKKKRNKRKLFLNMLLFLMFEGVFTMCTFPFVLLYGPFEKAKSIYVGTAMKSLSHQYLATWFLSDEKIAQIQGNQTVSNETTNVDDIQIPKIKDDTIISKTFQSDNGKYTGYYLIIKDPTRVKVGYSSKLETEGETTSEIAKNNNAIAAINGGAFTDSSSSAKWTGNGGEPSGLIMTGGGIVYSDIGGETGKTELLAFTKEGKMIVGKYSIRELRGEKVQEALSFTPVLIANGKKMNISVEWGISPRTAIGQRRDGAVILLVIDGRSIVGSKGASLTELQSIMYDLGAYNAMNLDGGKSTTMYYKGKIVNTPSNSMGERAIPSAIIVK